MIANDIIVGWNGINVDDYDRSHRRREAISKRCEQRYYWKKREDANHLRASWRGREQPDAERVGSLMLVVVFDVGVLRRSSLAGRGSD